MKVLKVGILGAGAIASSFHLPAWQKIATVQKVEITAICDTKLRKAKELAKIYHANYYTELSEMIEAEELDVLDVCTPNTLHYQHVKQSLEAELHTIVEKPFVTSEKQAAELINLARKKRKKLMCAQHARFRGDSIKAKEIISKGGLGEIYYIRAQSLQSKYDAVNNKTYVDSMLSGGGPLQDFGAHLVDLACWFSGFQKTKSISGSAFSKLFKSTKSVGDRKNSIANVEDLFVGTVKFKNGCVLFIETSFLLNAPENIMKIELYGDKGSLVWPDLIYTTRTKNGVRTRKVAPKKVVPASIGEIKTFVESIRWNRQPEVLPKESQQVVHILENMYLSASQDKTLYC